MRPRSRSTFALIAATSLAIAGAAPATAFDRVETSHSTDPGLLPGAKTPITAEVRVFGSWRARLAGESGSDMPPIDFTWQSGVPVPFALTYDGDVARFTLGNGIALSHDAPKNIAFDTLAVHAHSESAGYSIRVANLVLNVSSAGVGGPLAESAQADDQRPEDILLLRGVQLVPGFELSGQIIAEFGDGPPPSPPDLTVQLLLLDFGSKCPGDDRDCDGIPNADDNCPAIANEDQSDGDVDPATQLLAPDGVGDVCDNCASLPNADQLDTDHDGVGEACDNCASGCSPRRGFQCYNPDQSDGDLDPGTGEPAPDGFGDNCDNCPDDFNPEQASTLDPPLGDACVPTLGAMRPDPGSFASEKPREPESGPMLILRALTSVFEVKPASAQGTGSASFGLEFFCGGRNVSAANLSVNLPDGVATADFGGCGPFLAGPERRRICTQSTQLDPAVIDRSQTYTLGPEIASPTGIDSGVMILHLEGARAEGFAEPLLCRAGDPAVRIGTLTLSPLPTNAVPTLGNDWFQLFEPPFQALYDQDGAAIPPANLAVETGPALPRVELRASPDVTDVTGFRKYLLTIEAEFDLVSKLAVGISTGIDGILPSQMRVGGCAGTPVRVGGVDLVPCGASTDLGPGVATSSGAPPGTYFVRPNDPTLPAGTRPNTAYFVMVGKFAGLLDPSINYVNQRNKLALIEYLLPSTAATAPLPGVTFEGAAEVVAAVEGVPVESVTLIEHADEADAISLEDVLLAGGFDGGEDLDSDGHPDDADNCVNAANNQLDSGGVLIANLSDGIGIVCQCGDGQLANGGTVFPDDVPDCQDALAGAQTDAQTIQRCSVTGGAELDIEDLVILQQRTAGNTTAAIEQVCQPAVGAP